MIKPSTLWAQFKTCGDSKWIGDVCRALGGQDVDLDFGQRQMLNAIIADSGWMDERMEARKEATRKRVAAFRAKQTQTEDVTDVTPCNTLQTLQSDVTPHPSIHPSILPSILPSDTPNGVCDTSRPRTRARMDVPDERTVLSACTIAGVPEWYARWWYGEMTARDWLKTDGGRIDNRNWRPNLKTWWNHAQKDAAELEAIRAKFEPRPEQAPRTYTPDDWTLCAERCAHCPDGCGCRAGVKTPPQLDPDHPHPPQECPRYAPGTPQDAPGRARSAKTGQDGKIPARTAGTPHGAATGRIRAVPGVKTAPGTHKTAQRTPHGPSRTRENAPRSRPEGSDPMPTPTEQGNAARGRETAPGAIQP